MSYLYSIKNAASSLFYWGAEKLENLKTRWVQGYTAYALRGSLNLSYPLLVFQALYAQKNDIQKTRSYKHLNWLSRRFLVFPKSCMQHFISDSKLIRNFLSEMRNGEKFGFGAEPLIAPLIGKQNMLTCLSKNHRNLRSPFEALFTVRHLSKQNFTKEIARITLSYISRFNEEYTGALFSFVPFAAVFSLILGAKGDPKPYVNFIGFGNSTGMKTTIEKDYEEGLFETEGAMAALQKAEKKGKITKEDKISSTMMLLVTGVHTTKSLIEFAVQELRNNPKYVAKIEEEWQEFLIQNNLTIDTKEQYLDALNAFVFGENGTGGSHWLELCYLEAQRLHPVVPDIQRIAKVNMDIGGVKIRKNDEIHLNIHAVHRDEEIWNEPDVFKPERFEDPKARQNLLTFSVGSQSCIGKYLVPIEAKLVLGMLITLFKWNDKNQYEITPKTILFDSITQSLNAPPTLNPFIFSKKKEMDPIFQEAFQNVHPILEKLGRKV